MCTHREQIISDLQAIFSTEDIVPNHRVGGIMLDLYVQRHDIAIIFDDETGAERSTNTDSNMIIMRIRPADKMIDVAGRLYAAIHKRPEKTPGPQARYEVDISSGPLAHVPPEILVHIACWARKGNRNDIHTLRALSLVNKAFNAALRRGRDTIIEHYEVKKYKNGDIIYMFCGMIHRQHDLPAVIRVNEAQYWYSFGKLHRGEDKPAIVRGDSEWEWYKHGVLHRDDDQPAVCKNRHMFWYKNGLCHRDGDKPAIIWNDGAQEWYQHGKLFRDNDRPAKIRRDGTQEWYQRGSSLHRKGDKPAVVHADGTQEWYQYGRLHRCKGKPAIIYANGRTEFHRQGTRIY